MKCDLINLNMGVRNSLRTNSVFFFKNYPNISLFLVIILARQKENKIEKKIQIKVIWHFYYESDENENFFKSHFALKKRTNNGLI